jgi:protein TonB
MPPRIPPKVYEGPVEAEAPDSAIGSLPPCKGAECKGFQSGIGDLPFGSDRGFRPALPEEGKPKPTPRKKVSETVQQALLIHRVEPRYPPMAKQIGLQGKVELRAIIGRDGAIHSLEILSGHPILAKAAVDAISEWRYQPTILNGEAWEVETRITVIFTLQR